MTNNQPAPEEQAPEKMQSIQNLKGEVAFRRLLSRQHVTGEVLLPDYFGKDEHDAILAGRVETTRRDMKRLASQGVSLSPFVELGAERCHRAMVLVNEMGAAGIAADISLDQLRTARHFASLFGWRNLPLRVCCDVNHLPIRNRAVPFVFCYEFLHHFPDIKPVVEQVHRILADGHFYFSEEPFKRPRVRLYRQRAKIYAKHVLRRSKIVRTLEKFISEPWSDELEHGIVENDRISIAEWIEALAVFDEKSVRLASVGGRITSRLEAKIRLANLPNRLLGGGIAGLCRKKDDFPPSVPGQMTDLLLCPDCLAAARNSQALSPNWESSPDSIRCAACGSVYPIVDEVVLLLERGLFKNLYPEHVAGRRSP